MKKVFCAITLLGLVIAGTASALPAVELDTAGCELWLGTEGVATGLWTGTNAIWKKVNFIGNTKPADDWAGFPTSWAACNLENGFAGDGLLDRLQVGLVAAAICAGDPGVSGQFANNSEAFGELMATFYSLIAAVTDPIDLPARLIADAGFVTDIANGLPAGEPYDTYKVQLLALAVAMDHVHDGDIEGDPKDGASQLLADFADRFGTYVPIFEMLGPWFVAMGGTSEAMNDAMESLMFDTSKGIVKDVPTAGVGLNVLSGYLHSTGALLGGLGQGAVGALLEEDADALDAMVTIIGTVEWPDMEIYGTTAKTGTEPFSGPGDYDGNGDTNAQVAASVGSDPAAFVAAASGANVWYSGNPSLPVVGILGLALLAGACVMGGAASIRRK